jgi:hypothetical protein
MARTRRNAALLLAVAVPFFLSHGPAQAGKVGPLGSAIEGAAKGADDLKALNNLDELGNLKNLDDVKKLEGLDDLKSLDLEDLNPRDLEVLDDLDNLDDLKDIKLETLDDLDNLDDLKGLDVPPDPPKPDRAAPKRTGVSSQTPDPPKPDRAAPKRTGNLPETPDPAKPNRPAPRRKPVADPVQTTSSPGREPVIYEQLPPDPNAPIYDTVPGPPPKPAKPPTPIKRKLPKQPASTGESASATASTAQPQVQYGKLGDLSAPKQKGKFDPKNELGDLVGAPQDAPGRLGDNKLTKNVGAGALAPAEPVTTPKAKPASAPRAAPVPVARPVAPVAVPRPITGAAPSVSPLHAASTSSTSTRNVVPGGVIASTSSSAAGVSTPKIQRMPNR